MFDTMTFTKVMGSFCGALLIFLLGGWAAESLYHVGGGHGDDHQQAYVIDTGEDDSAEEEADTGPSFAELYASADTGKGERVFNKCRACHQLDEGAHGTGPSLYGVVGKDVGSADGFGYSGSLKAVADVWTPQELDAFLENPSGYAPGTTMGFAGLSKPEDRANVIAYLDMTDGDMTEVAAPAEEEAAAEPATEEGATEEAATEDAAAQEPMAEDGQDAETAAQEVTAEEPVSDEVAATPAAEAEAEDVTEDATAETDAGAGSEFAQMVAAADPADGENLWRRCQACHKLEEGANGVGPHLYGIVGRDIANVEGFRYSKALEELDGAWTVDELDAWLEDPRGYAPGNKMSYSGMRKAEDRAALIAYMQSVSN